MPKRAAPWWLLPLTRSLFNLSLGVWAGAYVMLGIAAYSAFEVMPRFEPTIGVPPFSEADFEGRQGSVLAGAVVNRSLSVLGMIGVAAVSVAWACVAVQHAAFSSCLKTRWGSLATATRAGALLTVTVLVVWDQQLGVATREQLAAMYDPASTAALRVEAKAAFDVLHARGESVNRAVLASVLTALVVSPFCFRTPEEKPAD